MKSLLMRPSHVLIACQLITALAFTAPTRSAAPAAEEPTAVDLELSPVAAPTPALRYRLLPTVAQRKPGSAYPIYARLTAEENDGFKRYIGQASDWLERPIDELDTPEVQKYLSRLQRVLGELKLASRRERCDWEYPIGEVDSFTMLLPDANESRMFWRVQALQVRHLVAAGKHEEAIQALQVGFAMARHIEQAPFVVHDLIAAACTRLMLAQIVEFVQSPDAPNLYWALAALPRPFVDVRPSIELEMDLLELSFPQTKQLDQIQTADAWKSLLDNLLRTQFDLKSDSPLDDERKFTAYLAECHAKADRYFLSREVYTSAQLEAMPLEELLVRWILHPYEEIRDERFKWRFVPFHQAEAMAGQFSREPPADPDQSPFAESLTQFAAVAGTPFALTQQHIAALQVVEALRMHAAASDGKLPSQLSEVQLVPIPIDPMTGKAFQYEIEGDTAELSSTFETAGSIHYRLRIRPRNGNSAPSR